MIRQSCTDQWQSFDYTQAKTESDQYMCAGSQNPEGGQKYRALEETLSNVIGISLRLWHL